MTPAERILGKALAASPMKSADWSSIQAGLRDRAFFSASVDDARRLAVMREAVAKVAAGDLSESQARLAIREALAQTGYEPPEGKAGGIQDLSSQRRLDLIIQTNVAEARGYVRYLEGTSEGALAAFPCQELVRTQNRKAPRNWPEIWKGHGGALYGSGRMIALKTDPIWTAISRFGHPWPPFDFGSGMGVRDVGRREAIRYGVISADDPPPKIDREKRPGFNDNLREHVPFSEVSPEWARLKETFGDQIQKPKGSDFVEWRGNLVRENFAAGGKFQMRLGTATEGLRGMLAARPETAALGEMLEGKQQLVVTDAWLDNPRKGGADHRDHFKPLEDFPGSKPLTIGDIELIPSIWRQPDRVFNAGGNCACLEIDSIEGDFYRAIVKCSRGAPELKTFYRTAEPYKEKR